MGVTSAVAALLAHRCRLYDDSLEAEAEQFDPPLGLDLRRERHATDVS